MLRLKLWHEEEQFQIRLHQLTSLMRTAMSYPLLHPLKDKDWLFTSYLLSPRLSLELLTLAQL